MRLKNYHRGLFQTLINVMSPRHLHSQEANLEIMFAKITILDANHGLTVCQVLCSALYVSNVISASTTVQGGTNEKADLSEVK